MSWRRLTLLVTPILAAFTLGTTAATAAPVWNLDIHHNQTNFAPGGTGEYWFDVMNVGNSATSGVSTLTIKLQKGLKRGSVRIGSIQTHPLVWSCPGSEGDVTIVCKTTTPLPRYTRSIGLDLTVDVDPTLEDGFDRVASATIEGGGAAKAAGATETTHISSTPAGFGIVPGSFVPDFTEPDGLIPVREAGSHPPLMNVPFDFNSVDAPVEGNPLQKGESGSVRNLVVDLPPGFIGNPTAVGECSAAALVAVACPLSSQVGKVMVNLFPTAASFGPEHSYTPFDLPVYNVSHPRGSVSDLAFILAGNPVHVKVSLDPANHYAITSHVPDINETSPPFGQKLILWGIPADSVHDSERCLLPGGLATMDTSKECSTDAPEKPFLTVPSQCEEDNAFRLHHYDSWQETGVFGSEIDYDLAGKFTNCDRPRFDPDVAIEPTGKQASTPTGLDVHVKIAQNENPDALATPPVKRFTVRLPLGMSFSPSFADGLNGCTLAQMKLGTNEPVRCPDASRIGDVSLHTPLLPKAAEGSMYLAAQHDNPFNSTFALLLVIHDTEERGALIKIPGRIDVDSTTGQITTIFDDNPQFPFDDLTLKFRSGARAPLVSPPTCGTQTIGVEVASYAQPQKPVDVSNSYEVTEGPNGTPCPPDSARRDFHPTFSAGTLNPSAGSYSPFLFRMTRADNEQELSQVTAQLPPGLLAKIAGIPFCPEQAIASISTAEGTGAQELAHPACPRASQVGSVSAGLGAGPGPNYFDGKVYLAGPYKGASLSLAVVAPAIAGPFDLGNVVVRTALYVDREKAQAKAVSDPFPAILHGVILRVRDVRLRMDRPETIINPTNCSPLSVDGRITGVGGDLLSTADDSFFSTGTPFQATNCASLDFKPKLDFRLFGGTRRGSHPKLRATLTMPAGGANIASASVALPHSEFLDQSHINTVCTRVQFAAEACPAGSIYGVATAKTPLLDETLTGNVYLRSSSNPLPDMVVAFRGGKIDVNVVGRIDSVRGGIRNTFDIVPDAPVETFTLTLQGGKKGLLVNSTNLCKSVNRATAKFTGQNGAAFSSRPVLQSSCKKPRKKKSGTATKHREARHLSGWLAAAF